MINTGEVASFINDIKVEMEEEERHNEVWWDSREDNKKVGRKWLIYEK